MAIVEIAVATGDLFSESDRRGAAAVRQAVECRRGKVWALARVQKFGHRAGHAAREFLCNDQLAFCFRAGAFGFNGDGADVTAAVANSFCKRVGGQRGLFDCCQFSRGHSFLRLKRFDYIWLRADCVQSEVLISKSPSPTFVTNICRPLSIDDSRKASKVSLSSSSRPSTQQTPRSPLRSLP